MEAPKVQTLAQIMADLEPANAKQTALIEQQRAGLGAKYTGQQTALDATKAQGFDAISANQRGRGNAFSGIPADEQATYLSTAYLPEVAKLKQQQNAENMGFDKSLADMYSQTYNSAFGERSNQTSALNSWNQAQENNRFSAAEAEKNRQFEANQNAQNRAATAANKAAETPSLNANIRAYLNQYVDPKTGSVPKAVWANAAQLAKESGLGFSGDKGFASTFWNYADNKKWWDYKNGYERYN